MPNNLTIEKTLPSLESALEELHARLMEIIESSKDAMTTEEYIKIRACINGERYELYEVLYQRGDQYGSDYWFQIGELGLLYQTLTKILRLKFSIENGDNFSDRQDSWVDLAGYAVLALAADNYKEMMND